MSLMLLSSFMRIRYTIFGLLVPGLRVGWRMCWNKNLRLFCLWLFGIQWVQSIPGKLKSPTMIINFVNVYCD